MGQTTRRHLLHGIGGFAAATLAIAPPARAEQVTVQWQTANLTEPQFEPVWKQMIAEFEALNPDIRIEPILVARKDDWTKFVTAAQARRAPCVVQEDLASAAYNGYLMPLDQYWNAEAAAFRAVYSDAIMAAMHWKGGLYGVPIWGGSFAEIYNVDLLKAAGLDPANLPTTIPQYLDWMNKLTKPGQWGTAVLGGPTDTTTRVLLTWIWANGGEAFNADMTVASFAADPKSLAAIKTYLGLVQRGLAAPSPNTTNYLEQTVLFEQGKIAAMRSAYWAIAKVLVDNPGLAGKMVVGPVPGNGSTLALLAPASISSSCKYPDAAWKFIKFQTEKKWALERARVSNWMPLRNDMANEPDVAKDPLMQRFLEVGANARSYPLPHPAWADIGSVDIVKAVQRALLDPAQTEQIFRDLDAALNKKLNDL
jgi:ABC-type glycerol-3-phosphate transport system substrate-binding protein